MTKTGQLPLPFRHDPPYRHFLPADSNAEARAWLRRPEDWPDGRLALWGEAGCGKTHLLHVWARPIREGRVLSLTEAPGDLAIDEADRTEPLALLHLLNRCAQGGHLVVLAARDAPARWNTGLADLDSRLRAMLAVQIQPPEDSLLEALLRQALAERQMSVPAGVQNWLRLRLPRTAQAIREAAEMLDVGSLQAHAPVTRALAAEILATLATDGNGDEVLLLKSGPPSSGGPEMS